MLRATSRVLKPGGLLSFLVIAVASGLSAAETNMALDAGPEHTDAGPGYPALMEAAGFEDIQVIDVTDEYVATLTAWIREWEAASTELEQLMGIDEFTERQKRRRQALAAARDGLLQRYLISAISP